MSDNGLMRLAATALVSASVALAQTAPTIQASPSALRFDDTNASYSQVISVTTETESISVDISADGGSPAIPPPLWLEVSSRTISTPGQIRVSLNGARRPVPGIYTARILLRPARTNLTPVVVTVTVEVKLASARFTVSPQRLQFVGQVGGFLPGQYLVLPPGFTCSEVTARTGANWLSVTPEPVPDCNRFLVSARPLRGDPGAYKGVISVTYRDQTIAVPVTAFLLPAGPWLDTNFNGFQFEVRQGNGNAITRNVAIRNRGTGTLNWRARDVFGASSWLSLGAVSGTATANADGVLPITVNPGQLTPAAYYGVIEVSAEGARNSPELFTVVMRIVPADTPAIAAPSPSGLVFPVVEGSAQSAAQAVTIFTSSTQAVPYRVWSQPNSEGASWLQATPTSGTTSTQSPTRFSVSVQPGTLKPGVYQGAVNVYLLARGSTEVRSVNVTMVVRPRPAAAAAAETANGRAAEGCIPSRLAATHTGLVSNFSTNVGHPTPINLRVLDDCGDVVNGAQAVLSFSNGDPPLVLTNLLNGNYAATWAPRSASTPVTIRADVAQATLSTSIELAGRITPTSAPVVSPDGVVNNFDRQSQGPLAPGTLIEIYGLNLSRSTAVAALENNRLPETLNDVSVVLGGTRLPLYAVSPDVLNAQVRMETAVDQTLPLVVRVGTTLSAPVRVPILAAQPGLLAFADSKVIAHDQNFALLSATNPAKRGQYIILYLVGMGVASPAVESGLVSPEAPLATVPTPPVVTLGGRQIQVLFAGLTPSVVGLYQINVLIPADIPPGDLPLVVRQGVNESNEVIVPVQ
jgi:uncharacterized protein (TIGR03437 family)